MGLPDQHSRMLIGKESAADVRQLDEHVLCFYVSR